MTKRTTRVSGVIVFVCPGYLIRAIRPMYRITFRSTRQVQFGPSSSFSSRRRILLRSASVPEGRQERVYYSVHLQGYNVRHTIMVSRGRQIVNDVSCR